jgi:hypothetical protein
MASQMDQACFRDNITRRACPWRQASSRDGGLTRDQSWIMEWSRA